MTTTNEEIHKFLEQAIAENRVMLFMKGTPEAPRTPFSPVPGMLEIPLTVVRMLGIDMPASGGGYFRLLPYPLTRGLLNHARHFPEINSKSPPAASQL